MMPLEEAVRRIERVQPNFDYDGVPEYAALIREFYSSMKLHLSARGMPLETPLIDSVRDEECTLPEDVHVRFSRHLAQYNDYGITIHNICEWYLREVFVSHSRLVQHERSLYDPLISILEKGGYFHEHNGALVLSDAATIPFAGR